MTRARVRIVIILAIALGLLVLAAANAHLVYVAMTSQPECVPHLKQGGDGQNGAFRAAKSACTPGARS